MNAKMTTFIEKLKTDKKTQVSTVTAAIAVIAVLVTSITVPVVVRHNKAKETLTEVTEVKEVKQTLSSETSAEIPAIESVKTQTEVENVSEPVSKYSVPTSTKPTGKNNSDTPKGNNSQKPAQKPTQAPEQPQTPGKKQWTQNEVSSVINEIKSYAINKGFVIDSSLSTTNTSWDNPVNTEWYTSAKIKSYSISCINDLYSRICDSFGYFPDGAKLNVVAQKYTDGNGYTQWEIYVVY